MAIKWLYYTKTSPILYYINAQLPTKYKKKQNSIDAEHNKAINIASIIFFHSYKNTYLPSVLLHCCLGDRKDFSRAFSNAKFS